MRPPLVLAMTGASGALYAVRLLECLLRSQTPVHLTISPSAAVVLQQELGVYVDVNCFRPADLLHSRLSGAGGPRTDLERLIHQTLEDLALGLEQPEPGGGILEYQHHADFMAPIASGSFLTAGMVICPCSGSTLSAVVHGASNNLIQRAADVHLKERRKLILVPRETPLSVIHLANMQRAAEAGAVILPAMPGWYHGVASLGDLVDFVVARILDQLGIENRMLKRWGEG